LRCTVSDRGHDSRLGRLVELLCDGRHFSLYVNLLQDRHCANQFGRFKRIKRADDFNFLTEEDKRHAAYGLCVGTWVASGAIVGSMAGGQTLIGAAGGAVWGMFTCPYLQQPIKRKLFDSAARLTDQEFKTALTAVKRQYPHISKRDALKVLLQVRNQAKQFPSKFRC
jgi:hypothetical protein